MSDSRSPHCFHAAHALLADGWARDVRLQVQDGRIAAISAGQAAQHGDTRVGILVPGLPNLHSHAFQRGMAGLTEIGGGDGDSFWSWRIPLPAPRRRGPCLCQPRRDERAYRGGG